MKGQGLIWLQIRQISKKSCSDELTWVKSQQSVTSCGLEVHSWNIEREKTSWNFVKLE